MILTLFIMFLAISLILIILGYFSANSQSLSILGFSLLFVLGVVLLSGFVEYKAGETATVTGNETVTVYNYSNYDSEVIPGGIFTINHLFGFLIAVLAIFGFIDVNMNLKGLK